MIADILDLLKDYAALQKSLVAALKKAVGDDRDWRYLTDVPRFGVVRVNGHDWRFQAHGTGVTFTSEESSAVVNAHSQLHDGRDLFDAGRIVEYMQSLGIQSVSIAGVEQSIDFASAPDLLRQLANAGEIVKNRDDGELYHQLLFEDK